MTTMLHTLWRGLALLAVLALPVQADKRDDDDGATPTESASELCSDWYEVRVEGAYTEHLFQVMDCVERDRRDCDAMIDQVDSNTPLEIYTGATRCFDEGRIEDGQLLMFMGRIRAGADRKSCFNPSLEHQLVEGDLVGPYELWPGLGLKEILQDPETSTRVYEALRDWQPDMYPAYTPPYPCENAPSTETYRAGFEWIRADRLKLYESYVEQVQ